MRWLLLPVALVLPGVVGCQSKDDAKNKGEPVAVPASPSPAELSTPAQSHPTFLDRLSPECRAMLLDRVAGFAFDPKRVYKKK